MKTDFSTFSYRVSAMDSALKNPLVQNNYVFFCIQWAKQTESGLINVERI